MMAGVAFALMLSLAGAPDIAGDLLVFHAGSLSVPMARISEDFMRQYPRVRVLREAAGSRECARKITDLNRPCDVMASADYAVIDTLLIPEFADWNIKFAGNELAIVFDEGSRYAAELRADNWFDILLRDDVAFGRSNPNTDPCGYRTVLALKLAEKYYQRPDLTGRFLKKDTQYIRPKETDLLALLETKSIDYIFLYRSVAVQHGLKWLALPDEVNLRNPELADHYARVCVELTGTSPGSTITQKGEPIVYGVTIPKCAPNPEAALAFVDFLLDREKGLAVMERNGQLPAVPLPTPTYRNIPQPLKRYALP